MKPAVRAFLLRWHRRVGLMAIAFIVVVSITGIALNHTKGLGLESTVHQPWLLALYGIDPPSMAMVELDDVRVVHDGVDRLYRDGQRVAQCGDFFAGAVRLTQGWMVACGDALWVFDGNHLVERIGREHGLPGTVEAVGLQQGGIRLLINAEPWALDLQTLAFLPLPELEPDLAWSPVRIVSHNAVEVSAVPMGSTLSLEQVILDLHSGRLFGSLTVLLMDLSGIAMLLLGLSGLWVWGSRRKQ